MPVSPAAADTRIEVSTPADDYHLPGSPTPLLVTISADRAVSGTLTATFDGNFGGSQQVEVAGGSTKQVLFITSTPPWSTSGRVSFDASGDGDSASARIDLRSPGTDEVVAVLPSLTTGRDLPASAELDIDLGTARLFPFDPELLGNGADVLTPFSQMIATAEDLEALDDGQLEALRSWIGSGGGTLVLDDAPGARSVLFDLEPVAGDDTAATFGVGRVRFTDGDAGDGDYDGLLLPTPSRAADDLPFGPGFFGAAPTMVLLASDAGVRIPPIGSLVALLAIYGLVAGPILWLVLKRTRREPLLWVVLPALALTATLGVYMLGRALRSETSMAHATIVADLPATRIVSTQVLLTAPNGGRAGVTLPDGWRPLSTFSEEMSFGRGQPSSVAEQFVDGASLVTDLPVGGVGVVHAESALPAAEPSWDFDLRLTDEGLEGTITNLTSATLEEVMVVAGQGFDQVTSLAPGESAEVQLSGANRPLLNRDRMMEGLMNNDPWSGNDGPANPGGLGNWLSRRPALRSPGFVMAVGWTRDGASPLTTLDNQTVDRGRTAYVTAERVGPSDLDDGRGRVEILRGFSTRVADPVAPEACADLSLSIRLTPDGTVDDRSVLSVPTRYVSAADLWVDGGWLPLAMAEADGPEVIVPLPATAFDAGALHARLLMSCEFWEAADPFPEVRRAGDSAPTAPGEDPDA